VLVVDSDTLTAKEAYEALELVIDTYTVAESANGLVVANVCVKVAVAVSDEELANVIESSASKLAVEVVTTAWLGIAEKLPNAKAVEATTAIRIRNVFFDITFLSRVALETFSMAAGKD